MFEKLLGTKEKKTQLYFYDDRSFDFKTRLLENTCLVEKDGDKLKLAWKHFYSCEIPFPGYKKVPAGMITLGFGRDIILDPFNKVREGTGEDIDINEKPKGKLALKKWIARIAENQRFIYRSKRESVLWTNRIIWTEIAIIVVMLIVWGIKYAWG